MLKVPRNLDTKSQNHPRVENNQQNKGIKHITIINIIIVLEVLVINISMKNHIIINQNIIAKRNQELENIMMIMIIRKNILKEVKRIIYVESSSEPSSPEYKKKID